MTTTPTRTVLISGASVAGPALAYWLSRYGFRPTVIERADTVRGGGYPIDVRGVAVDVLERMGVLPQVRAAHIHTAKVTVHAASGRPVRALDAEALFGAQQGHDVELPRGDLTAVLHERTREDVEYVFDDSISSLVEHEDGVHVTFRRGRPRTFDLVVGADGLHSNVRGLAFGPEAPFHRHLGFHFGGFAVPNHLGLDHEVVLRNTPGKLVALYGVGSRPTVHALLAFATPGGLRYDHHDLDAQRRLVAQAFADDGGETPRLLESMRWADDFFFDAVSQIRMPAWSAGRVALVGDAAHAPSFLSGQGTSLALVGAYVLAGELAAAGGDHRVALPAYEERLRELVDINQRLALTGSGSLIPATRTRIWARNQALRLLPLIARTNLVGRSVQRAATALVLPEYAAHPARTP